MKTKYLILLVGSLFVKSVTAFATDHNKPSETIVASLQTPKGNDVVYLTDGSIIYGTILFYDAEKSLKIKSNDGIDFDLPINMVLKMEKRTNVQTKRVLSDRRNRSVRGVSKGYQGYVDVGQSYAVGEDFSSTNTEFITSHGYRFNPKFFLGGGLGFIYYSSTEDTYIPAFVNMRADFLDKRISPFFDLKVGYILNHGGGGFFNPSFGVKFNFGRRLGLNVSLSYNYQKVDEIGYFYISGDNFNYREFSHDFNNLGFRVGLEF